MKINKKLVSFLLSLVLIFSFINIHVFANNKLSVENYSITVNLVDENNKPAYNVYVTLYSHLEKKFVDSGYTDKNGNFKLKYNPDEKLFSKKELQDIDLTVYAAPQDGDLVVYYFTKTYVIDDSKMSEEQKAEFLKNNIEDLKLSYTHKVNNTLVTDEYSKKVFKYLKDNNKISEKKPVHKITKKDKEDMIKKGIIPVGKAVDTSGTGDINALYDVIHDQGSKLTVVGEVHSIDSVTSTFIFSANSGVKIDVGIKSSTGDSWSIGGSVLKRAGWTEQWPEFSTTSTSGYGKQALTYFRYEVGETISYWSGLTTYEVYAADYNGGSEWGSIIFGDGAPAADIESNSLGSDWASHLPGAVSTYEVTEGKTYSIAASFPVIVNGFNLGTVTLGVSTDYNSLTKIEFKFGTKYSKYYTYGRNTNWKQIYVSNKSR